MIIVDHGGEAASPSLLTEVEGHVVLLTALTLAVDVEVVQVDGHKLGHIRHQQLNCPEQHKSEPSSDQD